MIQNIFYNFKFLCTINIYVTSEYVIYTNKCLNILSFRWIIICNESNYSFYYGYINNICSISVFGTIIFWTNN